MKKSAAKKTPHVDNHKLAVGEVKRHMNVLSEENRRHMSVLSEEFQGRVAGIAEQFGGLNKKLDEHGRILNTHTQMIGQLMVDVQEIKTELKAKVDRDEFSRLEKRVIALETRPRFARSTK